MKKITLELGRNILLTSAIIFMLGNYGCQKKSADSSQKELTEYIKRIKLDSWKSDKLKAKELQKMFGVLLYNQLPIEKDSISYKFHRVKGAIQNIGYFKNNEYVELNGWSDSGWIQLNYLNTDNPKDLLLQCTEYNRSGHKVKKELETIVAGNTITVTSFKGKNIAFKLYNSDGKVLQEGNYEYVSTGTRDTIIEFNPFNYEEKIKLVEEKKVKSGIWRYFDKDGNLVKEEKH